MNVRIVKLEQLSGNKTSIYSVIIDNKEETQFEGFLRENNTVYSTEIKDIIGRLITIGNKTGAREHFFKEKEGKPGDGVSALYDVPSKNLRLYCIRYGTQILILGGGGKKEVRALQEDDKLREENYLLRDISNFITQKIVSQDIKYINNGLELEGDLEFETNED